MKQTAVEWLIRNLEILNLIKDGGLENELFRQIELEAKEMEKENMVVFLQSVFGMEGFDYEKSYDDFISRRKNTKEELPKTEIDWSDMTDKDKETFNNK